MINKERLKIQEQILYEQNPKSYGEYLADKALSRIGSEDRKHPTYYYNSNCWHWNDRLLGKEFSVDSHDGNIFISRINKFHSVTWIKGQ